MATYPGTVTKVTRRSGTSYARGTTIDAHLQPEDNKALYEIWKPEWPEVLRFHGNETAITCEMVLEVNEEEFSQAFGKTKQGKAVAARILEVAKRNAGR